MTSDFAPVRDAGSFRDPSGYVFANGLDIYRTVNAIAEDSFSQVLQTGAIEQLAARGLLIPTWVLPDDAYPPASFTGARGELPKILLKHPKVPFISYAYEWTFGQLKDAAIAHLDLQLAGLEYGVALSDASTFNMQYLDGKFLHIDVLSLRPYKDGEPWAGYNQFCRMFLAPLLVEAWTGIAFQSLLRGKLEGLDLNEVRRILPRSRLWTSLNGLLHISLQARLIAQTDSTKRSREAGSKASLPRARFEALLYELRRWIAGLESGRKTRTYWNTYAVENTYSSDMRGIKHALIRDWMREIPGGMVWDIGGNSGEYSRAALDAGASLAVIFDSDLDSLEKAYADSRKGVRTLPLLIDLADPTPAQGWGQQERLGLNERSRPQGLMALAVIHHLAIGRNLPLEEVVRAFVDFAPHGVVEFVPKSDPMVVQMLSSREDIFDDYSEENFLRCLRARADITREHRFAGNGRLMVSYRRNKP